MLLFRKVIIITVIAGMSWVTYQGLRSQFVDDFVSMNKDVWEEEVYRFNGNACNMRSKMLEVKDGNMVISLDKGQIVGTSTEAYDAGGLLTKAYYKNGVFSFYAKMNTAPGTVCSFILANKWEPVDWEMKEVSINYLGRYPHEIRLAVKHLKNFNGEHKLIEFNHIHSIETPNKYHHYAISWKDNLIRFYIDEVSIFENDHIPFDDPMKVRITQWAAKQEEDKGLYDWFGKVDEEKLPSKVHIDWVKIQPSDPFGNIINPFNW